MTTAVRFAPSPTGRIHIGNVRTAVLNYLFAVKTGGSFMLRLDDTDLERSTDAFADGIRRDLRWLGMTWAREARQQDRFGRYREAADDLKAAASSIPVTRRKTSSTGSAHVSAPATCRPFMIARA